MLYSLVKKQLDRFYWLIRYKLALLQARKSARERIEFIYPKKLLVLCYGNIYRSPFVANYLYQKLDNGYEIRSAGFFPKAGRKSAQDYVAMVSDYGVDLGSHASQVVNKSDLNWADAVIIMDGKNFKLALLIDPALEHKLIWFGALSDGFPVEIEDPYNRAKEHQRDIIEHMVNACERCIHLLSSK